MRRKKPSLDSFFEALIESPVVAGNESLVSELIDLAEEHRVKEALSAVLAHEKTRLADLKKVAERIGPNPNGEYVTLEQLSSYGWGVHPESFQQLAVQKSSLFPKVQHGDSAKYYISADNAENLGGNGKVTNWVKVVRMVQLADLHVRQHESLLSRLSPNTESNLSSTAPHALPQDTFFDGKPKTAREIAAAGSNIKTISYIAQKLRLHKDKLSASKDDSGAWTGVITRENCHLVGLTPEARNSSRPETQSSEEKTENTSIKRPNIAYPEYGIWMTTREIMETGSPHKGPYLTQLFKRHSETFHPRREGMPVFAWVTPFNFQKLGLPKFPGAECVMPSGSLEAYLSEVTGKSGNGEEKNNERKSKLPDLVVDDSGSLWGTTKALHSLGSRFKTQASLYQTLRIKSDLFKVHEAGPRRHYYRLTEDNFRQAGFSKWPPTDLLALPPFSSLSQTSENTSHEKTKEDKPRDVYIERLNETRPSFVIGGKTYKFNPEGTYETASVRTLLRDVHPAIFNDRVIDSALTHLEANTHVSGAKLIEFLKKVDGLMPLSTTRTRKELENKVGGNFLVDDDFLHKLVSDPAYSQYVHTLPGIASGYFVNKYQLNPLAVQVRLKQGVVLERMQRRENLPIIPSNASAAELVTYYHRQFDQKGIMPSPEAYQRLLRHGVLRQDNADLVRSSYERFAREMKGWELHPLPNLQKRLGLEWKEFMEDYLVPLEREGKVKNIARGAPGVPTDIYSTFYVVKQGESHAVENRIIGLHRQAQKMQEA